MSVLRGRMIGMRIGSTRKDLRTEIDACGYFPEFVEDAMMLALGDEELVDFVVQRVLDQLGVEVDVGKRWKGGD